MNAVNYFIACRPYGMPIGYKIVKKKDGASAEDWA